MLVDSVHDGPQQLAELRRQCLELLVEWVPQQIAVEVSDQMDKAFLLGAVQRVVAAVEIGDENPREALEQSLEEAGLPAWPVQIQHVLHVRQHPDIAFLLLQIDFGLVSMGQLAAHDPGEDSVAGLAVAVGHQGPDSVKLFPSDTQTEAIPEHGLRDGRG